MGMGLLVFQVQGACPICDRVGEKILYLETKIVMHKRAARKKDSSTSEITAGLELLKEEASRVHVKKDRNQRQKVGGDSFWSMAKARKQQQGMNPLGANNKMLSYIDQQA